ncbi:molybdotransferase-like divisome protein Glp [Corynebacterium frankenforstense]
MRSVEEQLELVTDAALTPEPVRVSIVDSLGLMCAEEVQATHELPGFAQAAVDGYAVRAVDVGGERALSGGSRPTRGDGEETGPFRLTPLEQSLPVVGEVAAGSQQPLRLQPRQAVRVHTGAALPALADAVLPLAWSDRGRRRVVAARAVRSGDFVRRPGDDIGRGDVAVTSGAVLGPAQVGLLAAAGRANVLVYPRPRLSVISVGAELVDVNREPGLGQTYDVAGYALAAAAKEAGADVHRVGIAAGEPRRLREIIESQLMRSEILVITGAVGGSGALRVQEVLREFGDVDTTRVAMHPGSVQGFGLLGDERTPVFLTPSNPVSSLVIFEVLARPLIRLSLGKRNAKRRVVRARALGKVASRPGRTGFIRARLMRDAHTGDYLVEGLGGATGAPAHLLAGLAQANAMIRVPADAAEIRPGDVVDVIFLSQAG